MRRPSWLPVTDADAVIRGPAEVVEAWGQRRAMSEWARLSNRRTSRLRELLTVLPAEIALAVPLATQVDLTAQAGEPHAWNWDVLPFDDDPWAQAFVRAHPSGATLEEVGRALGLVRERVRQIEETALRKIRRAEGADDEPEDSRAAQVGADVRADGRGHGGVPRGAGGALRNGRQGALRARAVRVHCDGQGHVRARGGSESGGG